MYWIREATMKKYQILLRVVVLLLVLGCSGSLLPLGMAQTNGSSATAPQTWSSESSTMGSAVTELWQKIVSWLVDDARSDEPSSHVLQTGEG